MKRFLSAAFAFAWAFGMAHASPVLVDFEERPLGWGTENFESKGFLFSASRHFDLINVVNNPSSQPAPFGNWLGFDPGGGCSGGPVGCNDNYLGPTGVGAGARMYVAAADGSAFDLLSLNFMTVSSDSFGWTLYSSEGGQFTVSWMDGNFIHLDFSGNQWRNLTWLVFDVGSPGAPAGFDNLLLETNSVSAPSTASLAGLSLLLLAYSRNRRLRR